MAITDTQDSSARPRRWSLSEKRRIVGLTQSKGASISEIALAHDLHPTSLSHWRSLYRAGKLSDGSPRERSSGTAAKSALLPVVISARRSSSAPALSAAVHSVASSRAHESDIVHVTLSSGAAIRIEGKSLDASLVCALLAELR
jgi:transposase-like protein